MPSYPADAACGRSGLDPSTWDEEVAGETGQQRMDRYKLARAVCRTCPVADTCETGRAEGGGVRNGEVYGDEVPGWTLTESNAWHGRSRDWVELHGNMAGVRRHYRDGTNLCAACRGAQQRDNHDAYIRDHAA